MELALTQLRDFSSISATFNGLYRAMFLPLEITKRKMDKVKPNADIGSTLASLRKELVGMSELQLNRGAQVWVLPLTGNRSCPVKHKVVSLSVLAFWQKIICLQLISL